MEQIQSYLDRVIATTTTVLSSEEPFIKSHPFPPFHANDRKGEGEGGYTSLQPKTTKKRENN